MIIKYTTKEGENHTITVTDSNQLIKECDIAFNKGANEVINPETGECYGLISQKRKFLMHLYGQSPEYEVYSAKCSRQEIENDYKAENERYPDILITNN